MYRPELFPVWIVENKEVIGTGLAIIALATTLGQTFWTNFKDTKRFSREAKASKAAIVHHLDAICKYCTEIIDALLPVKLSTPTATSKDINVEIPIVPPVAIQSLSDFLKTTNKRSASDRCIEISVNLQILKSSTDPFNETEAKITASYIEQCILRALILHALTLSLLAYTRGDTNKVTKFDWDDVDLSKRFFNIQDISFQLAMKEFHDKYPGDPLQIFS